MGVLILKDSLEKWIIVELVCCIEVEIFLIGMK